MSISHLSLFKRSNAIWYILYEQEGRKRWKTTGSTLKSEALKKLTDFKKLTTHRPETKTLSQFINEFLSYAEVNFSSGTVGIYRSTLNRFKDVIGDKALTYLTQQHIDIFKVERLRKLSPTTMNIELRTLRAAFNTAVRWNYIEGNPLAGVKLVQIPEQSPTFFTKEDFQKLISIVKEHWLRELIIFAVLTGLRRGEILNLRWKDIDLQQKLIHIESNPTFKTKQGKKRTIPLNDVALHLLHSKHGISVGEYIFTLNDRKILDAWLSHKFKYYVYKARLNNDKLHFHSLRHTFASWLVQDGVSLYEVQKLLGHSNISVTQVYSHLQPEKLHATVNRISILLN